jgi:hypothetical protein
MSCEAFPTKVVTVATLMDHALGHAQADRAVVVARGFPSALWHLSCVACPRRASRKKHHSEIIGN